MHHGAAECNDSPCAPATTRNKRVRKQVGRRNVRRSGGPWKKWKRRPAGEAVTFFQMLRREAPGSDRCGRGSAPVLRPSCPAVASRGVGRNLGQSRPGDVGHFGFDALVFFDPFLDLREHLGGNINRAGFTSLFKSQVPLVVLAMAAFAATHSVEGHQGRGDQVNFERLTIGTPSFLFMDSILKNIPFFESLKPWFITSHMATWVHVFECRIPWKRMAEDYAWLFALNATLVVLAHAVFSQRDFKS